MDLCGSVRVFSGFQHYVTESPLPALKERMPQHGDTPPKPRCAPPSGITVILGGRGRFCCREKLEEGERAELLPVAAPRSRTGGLELLEAPLSGWRPPREGEGFVSLPFYVCSVRVKLA